MAIAQPFGFSMNHIQVSGVIAARRLHIDAVAASLAVCDRNGTPLPGHESSVTGREKKRRNTKPNVGKHADLQSVKVSDFLNRGQFQSR